MGCLTLWHWSCTSTKGKTELVSANSRLFSRTELRLSTILRECSAIIYALSEYELLIQGSPHPIILSTDHKKGLLHYDRRFHVLSIKDTNQLLYHIQETPLPKICLQFFLFLTIFHTAHSLNIFGHPGR